MKWTIGIIIAFAFCYFCVPFLFGAMKKHDYETMYRGMQDAKRSGGAFVQEDKEAFVSYSERYARGLD